MAEIYFEITGNGTAYCAPASPTIYEEFTFYAIPYEGESLLDVRCYTAEGYSMAVPVSTEFTVAMPDTQYITFYVDFTGETPPTPTPTTHRKKRMPIWMYPCLRY